MKNQKVIMLMTAILVISAILAACGADPINKDLMSYVNEKLIPIAEIETNLGNDYESFVGDNFVDDDTLSNKLKEVIIPNSTKLLETSEAVQLETEEVKKVHAKYIESIKVQHEAFVLLQEGAQKHDNKKVDEANEKFAQAQKLSDEYNTNLKALAKEHEIEIDDKNN